MDVKLQKLLDEALRARSNADFLNGSWLVGEKLSFEEGADFARAADYVAGTVDDVNTRLARVREVVDRLHACHAPRAYT